MTRLGRVAFSAARVMAGAVVVSRIAGVARAAPPIGRIDDADAERQADVADDAAGRPLISIVIPARDEARRIGPVLDAVVGAPGVDEVLVIDDESSDDTAAVAAAAGATVMTGAPKPQGWAGKAWALHQGIDAAHGEWIVTLDADTRPDPGLPASLVDRAERDGFDLLTLGGSFVCPTPGTRWLHASMLTTLVYRFGPPGVTRPAARTMANGQCTAFRRDALLDAGGMSSVAHEVVEDVSLARSLAGRGWNVGFLDAAELLRVTMFESFADTWHGWGRSLALPGVEPLGRQLADLFVVLLAQALPLPRLLLRRGDAVDAALVLMRVGTLIGTRTAYDRADLAYWTSPAADLVSWAALARGISRRRRQTWRGRTYT